jgi:hypothetical protein
MSESKAVEAFIFPVSFEQQRLWFLDQLAPGSTAYNTPAGFRIKGAFQVEALENSLRRIIERHEILRTTFASKDGQPVQVVHQEVLLDFVAEDLSAIEDLDCNDRIQAVIAQELRQPFDLARGPLVRSRLLRFAPDDHFLLISMHHIITDGWSVGILFQELATLYAESYSGTEETALPPLEIQYADYAVWQREQAETGSTEHHLDYWKKQLHGMHVNAIAPDYAGVANHAPASVLDFHIGRDRAAKLEELGRANGATLFMTLLAALKTVMRYLTNRQETVVGTDVANRLLVETQPLIGFFVNQLVLRTALPGSLSFQDALKRVRGTTLEAYEHQEVPFDRLVKELRPERTTSTSSPFFQVKLVLQNTPQAVPPLGGLIFEPVNLELDVAKFEIMINVREEADGLRGALHYRSDLFSTDTAERIIGLFEQVIDLAVNDSTTPLDDINRHLRQTERARANRRETEFQESSRKSLSMARRVRAERL